MLSWYTALPPQIYEGYQSIWPLPAGFSQRQPIYQLYYLLNRANVFGGEWLLESQRVIGELVDADEWMESQASAG